MNKKISFILPARGRSDMLKRLFKSIVDTTHDLKGIEVILCLDEDDLEMLAFKYEGVSYKKVVVRPGLRMGELNMAAYKASSGKYIMLLNDDVVIRTPGWDEKTLACFKAYADEIVLVHVNDLIFKKRLCTFPFVSRTFCEIAGELCPEGYHRHRIDDHIYDIFNLLGVMGRKRIVYLPDVVFEHEHYTFSLLGRRKYGMLGRIVKDDARLFEALLPQRKRAAAKLMAHIDGFARSDTAANRDRILDTVQDSNSIRKPEFVNTRPEGFTPNSANTRVTVGVVSADSQSKIARNCLDRIKRHTDNYDLILLDNNHGPDFNHSREMNRIMEIVQTDYLVLMDDDALVEPGWLDGLLQCMGANVGVVTPVHKDREGNLSFGGIVFSPDRSGRHSHILSRPESARPIMTLYSACLLIDMNKCRHIRFNENYYKYFLDIDYGLRIWEAGYQVVCSPFSEVTHLAGGTLSQAGLSSNILFKKQRRNFESEWYASGRIEALEKSGFYPVSEFRVLTDLSEDVKKLLERQSSESIYEFRKRALEVYRRLAPYPILKEFLFDDVEKRLDGRFPDARNPEKGHLAFLMGLMGHPVLIAPVFNGFQIIFCDQIYYAIPATERFFDLARIRRHQYDLQFSASTLQGIEQKIAHGSEKGAHQSVAPLRKRLKNLAFVQLIELQLFCLVWLILAKKCFRPIFKDMAQPGFGSKLVSNAKSILKALRLLRNVPSGEAGVPANEVKLMDSTNSLRQQYNEFRRKYHHFRMMLCAKKQFWVLPTRAAARLPQHRDIQSCRPEIATESSRQTEMTEEKGCPR